MRKCSRQDRTTALILFRASLLIAGRKLLKLFPCRLRALRWESFYWANSTALLEDLKTHEGENEGFWIQYSHRRLHALGHR